MTLPLASPDRYVVFETLDGYILPLREGQPVVIRFEGRSEIHVPLFSTMAALELARKQVPSLAPDQYMVLTDTEGFLSSIRRDGTVKVIVDPVVTPEGKSQYKTLVLDGGEPWPKA